MQVEVGQETNLEKSDKITYPPDRKQTVIRHSKGREKDICYPAYLLVRCENANMFDREMGVPKTDEERRRRHSTLYPGEKLPPRGTGLQRGSAAGSKNRDRLVDLLLSILFLASISLISSLFSSRKRRESKG